MAGLTVQQLESLLRANNVNFVFCRGQFTFSPLMFHFVLLNVLSLGAVSHIV